MFGYVTDEQFVKLWERWEKTDISVLDPRIVPTLTKLAEHPDLVPVWSCSGHSGAEQEKKKPGKKTVTMLQSRYIYFGVRKGQTKIFENFDKYTSNLKYIDYTKIHPRMTTMLLNYGIADKDKDLTTFSVWKVEIIYKLCSDSFRSEYALSPSWVEDLWDKLIYTLLEE